MSTNNAWLSEQLKTVRNLTDVSLLLINTGNTGLLATILELLYEQAQTIIDENCVVGFTPITEEK